MTIEITVKDKKGEIVDYRIINALFPIIIANFSKDPQLIEIKGDEAKFLVGYELKPITIAQKRVI